jgi:hypothetical protein
MLKLAGFSKQDVNLILQKDKEYDRHNLAYIFVLFAWHNDE